MFETPITVVGRIITDLRRRVVAGQEVISFRMASNSRRRGEAEARIHWAERVIGQPVRG